MAHQAKVTVFMRSDPRQLLLRKSEVVVPVTSHTDRIYPFQALLPADETGLRQDSKAQAEQVRSIPVERLGAVLGRVPAEVMARLDDALRLHLQI